MSIRNERINVLQIVEGISRGGAEGKLFEMIQHMDSNRFNTTLVSLGLGEEIPELVTCRGISYLSLPRKHRFDLRVVRALARMMKERQIDVVMTTLFYADVMGAIAGRMAGVKGVISWETISAPEWLIKRRLWPYRFAIRYCDRVVSVSKATARWLVDERGVPEEKVMVIPYGVNDEVFTPGDGQTMRKSMGFDEGDFIIGMVARLHPQKGHSFLLEAAVDLVDDFPNVRFAVVGEGEKRAELEDRTREMGLDNHVRFLGHRKDIHEVLRAFDVFTLPSLYEGLPNVVLEAMAAGKPVVASSVDGTVEAVLDGETGFLVPPGHPALLREAYVKLLTDNVLLDSMGKAGRKRVEEKFSLNRQVEAFQDLYKAYYNGKDSVI